VDNFAPYKCYVPEMPSVIRWQIVFLGELLTRTDSYRILTLHLRNAILIYQKLFIFRPWRNGPHRAWAASFLRLLDHTHNFRHTRAASRNPLNEWSVRCGDRYVHNRQKIVISTTLAGSEPAIPAIKRLQTYILHRTATDRGRQH